MNSQRAMQEHQILVSPGIARKSITFTVGVNNFLDFVWMSWYTVGYLQVVRMCARLQDRERTAHMDKISALLK